MARKLPPAAAASSGCRDPELRMADDSGTGHLMRFRGVISKAGQAGQTNVNF